MAVTKFNVDTQIGKVCEESSSRYALGFVRIVPGGKGEVKALATDGRILAAIDYPGETDAPRMVPADVFPPTFGDVELIRERPSNDDAVWRCGKKCADSNLDVGKFPDVAHVFPSFDEGESYVLTLDSNLLLTLAKALNTKDKGGHVSLIFTLPKPDKGGGRRDGVDCVIGVLGERGAGVLMPIESDEGIQKRYAERVADIVSHIDKGSGDDQRAHP